MGGAMINEKSKIIFDKLANAGIVFVGYEFLFMLYVILYGASGNMPFSIGIVLFIGGVLAIILTMWIFIAVLYDIYTKL